LESPHKIPEKFRAVYKTLEPFLVYGSPGTEAASREPTWSSDLLAAYCSAEELTMKTIEPPSGLTPPLPDRHRGGRISARFTDAQLEQIRMNLLKG